MTNWRAALLRRFVPGLNQPTLVHDPDHLLADELMARALSERGFTLLEYDDPIAFRWRYESEWRAGPVGGDLLVITTDREPETLPWDLVRDGRIVTLDLAEAFPQLHPAVLRELDGAALDALYDPRAAASDSLLLLSAARTREHVLQRAYGFDPAASMNEVSLLRALLRLHTRGQRLPRALAEALAQRAAAHPALREWPVSALAVDAGAFLEFLQERWPIFLRTQIDALREPSEPYGLRQPGPALLPFDDIDVRVYVDDLFHEGRLTPVLLPPGHGDKLARWMRFGVSVDAQEEQRVRAERLIDAARAVLPAADARHDAWAVFAQRRAEAAAVDPEHPALIALDDVADRAFADWLERHYGGLASLSPARPALVSHIARSMARQIEAQPGQRMALIVVDGLALEQWCALREIMSVRDSVRYRARLRFDESALFAWIPTLTSVSRQAIFAGAPPRTFPDSIGTTEREPKLWRAFWENHAVPPGRVRYARSLGRGRAADELRALLEADPQVLGLVVDVVDGIMHGMQLGAAGMRSQVRQWAERGYMNEAVDLLLERGYRVWLTADHGNAACRGAGAAGDGAWAEQRGARVRVYRAPELRAHAARGRAHVGEWTPPGLPSEFHPLFADGSSAFAAVGEVLIGHGGRAVREVIVPFVEVRRVTES